MSEGRGRRAHIVVLAGTNGAGKSSVAGAALRALGGDYFNPDEAARRLVGVNPALLLEAANSMVWRAGRDRLVHAIEQGQRFALETTLGGTTIPGILLGAARGGAVVRIWYVGLDSVEHHTARVRARAAQGGHEIPESLIRARFDRSRRNLVTLVPHLAELQVWDNSAPGDPGAGSQPEPLQVLHVRAGVLRQCLHPGAVPGWAKPIVQAVLVKSCPAEE